MDFIVSEKACQSSMSPVHLSNSDAEQRLSSSISTSWAFRKGLSCTVCGAPAIGFNFSVITCMCCKAFFRRNALYGLQVLKCRYSTQQCTVSMRTRRDCSYCRLKKCFEVGMKKELILNDNTKQIKREKLYANQQLTIATIRPSNLLFHSSTRNFHINNSTLLSNIYNAYEQYCRLPIITFENREIHIMHQQPPKSRIKIQRYYNLYCHYSSSLIDFFKHIPEFQQLPNDEQIALSMHNLRFLLRINLLETLNGARLIWTGHSLLLELMFSKPLVETLTQHLFRFKSHVVDPLCIRLLLIIILFSTYPTYHGNIRSVDLYKIQEHYIVLLWSHLQEHFGEHTARQLISAIVRDCLRLQTIGHEIEQIRHDQDYDDLHTALSNSMHIT